MSNPKPGEITLVTKEELERRVQAFMPAKTVEQKTLEVLERIERFLYERFDDERPVYGDDGKPLDVASVIDKITPTPTPFMEAVTTKKKRKVK